MRFRVAGEFRLPISAEHRASSGVEVGDEVEVEIEPDTQAREVEVPNWLHAGRKRPAWH
jgi:hypothetical protein